MPFKNSTRKGISLFIKLLIAACCFGYIWNKLTNKQDLQVILDFFQTIEREKYISYLSLVVCFMLLNWGIEAVKWKLLIRRLEEISFVKAVKSILSGLTISVFTPNRVGEFGGRIFYLKTSDRIGALLISIMGSFSQLTITLLFGAVSIGFYLFLQRGELPGSSLYLFYGLTIVFFLAMLVILFLYLNPFLWIDLIKRWKFAEKVTDHLDVLKLFSQKDLLGILLLSAFRYIIFSSQFLLLLELFHVSIPFLQGMMMIALTFFAITVVPTVTITELGVRGSAALLFIGSLSQNHEGIISASFMLWIINIALPALGGIPFVFKLNFFSAKKT